MIDGSESRASLNGTWLSINDCLTMTKKNIKKCPKITLVKKWSKIVQKKPLRFEMLENTDVVLETTETVMKK